MQITVLDYRYAPENLRGLSDHGGDEDEILIFSKEAYDTNPMWIDKIIGRLDVYDLGDGTLHEATYEGNQVYVYIIAHA